MSTAPTTKYPYLMTPDEQTLELRAREARLVRLAKWRDDAIADGWTATPTYNGELLESAATLRHPDGYVAMMLTRPGGAIVHGRAEWPIASLSVWCPREIDLAHALPADDSYDFERLVAGRSTCPVCGATGVDTVRVAFANRACNACAPALRRQIEVGNWAD